LEEFTKFSRSQKSKKNRKEEKKKPVQTLFKNQFLSKNRKNCPFFKWEKKLKKKTSSTHTCQGIRRYGVATMLCVNVYVHRYVLYSRYILYGMYAATVYCFLSFDCNWGFSFFLGSFLSTRSWPSSTDPSLDSGE